MTALQGVFGPQTYKRMFGMEEEQGGESIGRFLTPFAYASIAFGILVVLLAEEIVTILAPESYHEAIDVVIVLAMFYGIMFFGKQPQLIYAKKTHFSSIIFLVSMALNVGLNIPFIMKWGINGAAWATFIAGLGSIGISFAVGQHYYRIAWEYKKLGAIYLLFFVSAISMIYLRQISLDYSIRFGVKLLLALAYGLLGVRLRIITKSNLMIVRELIRSKMNNRRNQGVN